MPSHLKKSKQKTSIFFFHGFGCKQHNHLMKAVEENYFVSFPKQLSRGGIWVRGQGAVSLKGQKS
jgi:hypothetical protein